MKKIISTLLLVILFITGCHRASDSLNLPRGEVSAKWTAAADGFRNAALSIADPEKEYPYGIMVLEHGKVVFEQWYGGMQKESRLNVYSISKTVTALATGCAVAEGLITVDDKVIDCFPDRLPENVSDTLSAMTIRHLLTMSCGLEETPDLMSAFGAEPDFDWISEFFASRQVSMPGTQFYYNFFTPYILSAIIEKKAGMGLMDYIKPRLLDPLHISDMEWEVSPEGICVGGWGMFVNTEDIAKVGQLLLQHGKWNGRQLVPAQWVDTMTSKLLDSVDSNYFIKAVTPVLPEDPENEHSQGYGYYVWQGKRGTYRMEGILGNYALINPETETIITLVNQSQDNQFIDLILEYFSKLI